MESQLLGLFGLGSPGGLESRDWGLKVVGCSGGSGLGCCNCRVLPLHRRKGVGCCRTPQSTVEQLGVAAVGVLGAAGSGPWDVQLELGTTAAFLLNSEAKCLASRQTKPWPGKSRGCG